MQSLLDSCNDRDICLDSVAKLTEDFTDQLEMNESIIDDISNQENEINDHDQENETEEEEEHDGEETDDCDDDDDDEEFSFVCGTDTSPIAAEEVFYNGQIRPMFPLFNGDFVLADGEFEKLEEQLHLRPSVKKVFIETEDNSPATTSSSSTENEEIAGPYCEWSKKAVEVETNSDQSCKKSNSTGFSKLWRFRDFGHRSNSDGRDAFVFLNNSRPKTGEQVVQKKIDGEVKVNRTNISGEKVTQQKKKKKTIVKKSEAVLAHEAYMKSRAKDGERRRSYLPYRPELVGFFTNVNGGLTRNVHPF